MEDSNAANLKSVFRAITQNALAPENEKFSYLILKNFTKEVSNSKELFVQISKFLKVNLCVEQAPQILRSLELFDWNEIDSTVKLVKVWFYCINNIFGENFVGNKYEGLISSFNKNIKEDYIFQSSPCDTDPDDNYSEFSGEDDLADEEDEGSIIENKLPNKKGNKICSFLIKIINYL